MKHKTFPAQQSSPVLRAVQIRPIQAAERSAWDELMSRHHYLGLRSLPGKSLRYVATFHDRWLALIGWSSGAFKCAPRDRWVGWIPIIRRQRLELVANNARFLILPGVHIPNLASRVLALNTRRLSQDWCAVYGHPIYLAETFVDSRYFKGTCYRAAGWSFLGYSSGFRKSNKHYFHHGHPKMVFVRALHARALEQLADPGAKPLIKRKPIPMELSVQGADKLLEMLAEIPDPRMRRGVRHSSKCLLAICACAVLCGAESFDAIAQWAQCCSQDMLRRLHCTYRERTKSYIIPSEPTIRRFLQSIDAEAVDSVLSQWFFAFAEPDSPLAVDGKTVRGARSANGRQLHLLSAFLHKEAVVAAQSQVDGKTNEIKAVRPLLDSIDVEGRAVTFDALHAQKDTARYLVEEKKADYVITVKGNQPTLRNDLEMFFLEDSFPPSARASRQGTRTGRNSPNPDHHRTQRLC